MSRKTKISLITAALLVLIGIIIFGGVMIMLNWDFKNLSTTKYVTNEYIISEEFTDIAIDTDTADIELIPYDDELCKIVCFEEKNALHSVYVENGTLCIKVKNNVKWYMRIGINFKTPKISVYLPEKEYRALNVSESTGDIDIPSDFSFKSVEISASTGNISSECKVSDTVKIKLSTGDIKLSGAEAKSIEMSATTGDVTATSITADNISVATSTGAITMERVSCTGNIKFTVSTGKAKISDTTCASLYTKGTTGKVTFKNVIANGSISVERSTGDVSFDACDGAEIFVKTSTGDVTGSFLSDKIFSTNSDTGRIRVPSSASGGRCEVKTDTGNIIIQID